MEKVLDWCQAMGYRTGNNPARWKGGLKERLPQPSKISTVHHFAALPYAEVPQFFTRLQRRAGTAARALQFSILAAARSGEIRGAEWNEFDLSAKVWTVPPARMKMKHEHRVPLCNRAITFLKHLSRVPGSALLFPSVTGGHLSDTALLMVLRRMKVEAVPHGFRSSFKTWGSEATAFPRDVIEAALAHSLENKVEAAYLRGDLLDKRRALMEAWAAYCYSAKK